LCSLKEVCLSFKERNPEKLLGFSKFAELWPENCELAVASGTHAVCVYTIDQNVKLMILGAKLYDLTEKKVKTYDAGLSKIIFNVPSILCCQGDFEMCAMTENLIKNIE
jgi:hypothetical protein